MSEEIKIVVETQKSEYAEIPDTNNLKFRPIVSGLSYPIKRLGKLIDILRQPFLNKIKSYIRDDIHFLNSRP